MRLPLEETLEQMVEPVALERHHPYLVYQPLTLVGVVAVGNLELREPEALVAAALVEARVQMEPLTPEAVAVVVDILLAKGPEEQAVQVS